MGVLGWIILGLAVGLVAYIIDTESSTNHLLGMVILGIMGALVGGLFTNLIFNTDMSLLTLPSLLVSLFSALLIVTIHRISRDLA